MIITKRRIAYVFTAILWGASIYGAAVWGFHQGAYYGCEVCVRNLIEPQGDIDASL